jgi:hypothetical protein
MVASWGVLISFFARLQFSFRHPGLHSRVIVVSDAPDLPAKSRAAA